MKTLEVRSLGRFYDRKPVLRLAVRNFEQLFVNVEAFRVPGTVVLEVIDPTGRTVSRLEAPETGGLMPLHAEAESLFTVDGIYRLRATVSDGRSMERWFWMRDTGSPFWP